MSGVLPDFGSPTFQVELPSRPLAALAAPGINRVSTRWYQGSARAMPCKGWPSATAFGGFGLDKALPVRRFAAIGSTPSYVDHVSQFHLKRRRALEIILAIVTCPRDFGPSIT